MKDSEIIKKAEEYIKEFLKYLNIDCKSKVSMEADEADEKYLKVIIEGDDLGYLIGYRGKTLNALQVIFGQIISNEAGGIIRVLIDVNDYRQRRKEYLGSLAYRAVREVRDSGQSVDMPALSAYERRIVHMTLKGEEDIKTESEGEDEDRHIVIKPVKKGKK